MQKNAKKPLPVNSKVSKPVNKSLSLIRILFIVVLGSYSGMMANRFFTQESQGYNKKVAYVERQQIEKQANFKSERFKKANKKEVAEQKIVMLPVVTVPTITGAYNENTIADDLKIFKVPGTVSDVIAGFIGHPYITLPGET